MANDFSIDDAAVIPFSSSGCIICSNPINLMGFERGTLVGLSISHSTNGDPSTEAAPNL
jgi:hypothetical protein